MDQVPSAQVGRVCPSLVEDVGDLAHEVRYSVASTPTRARIGAVVLARHEVAHGLGRAERHPRVSREEVRIESGDHLADPADDRFPCELEQSIRVVGIAATIDEFGCGPAELDQVKQAAGRPGSRGSAARAFRRDCLHSPARRSRRLASQCAASAST